MAFGDGRIARGVLDALVAFLHQFASPTGARGSILLMAGGLVVLGFLFLALLFRSVVIGDIAPRARRAAAFPSVSLPRGDAIAAGANDFATGRAEGREGDAPFDGALSAAPARGLGEVRILSARLESTRVRFYAGGPLVCERARGYLVGAFERTHGGPVKVDEVACRNRGDAWCEYEARHPPREAWR